MKWRQRIDKLACHVYGMLLTIKSGELFNLYHVSSARQGLANFEVRFPAQSTSTHLYMTPLQRSFLSSASSQDRCLSHQAAICKDNLNSKSKWAKNFDKRPHRRGRLIHGERCSATLTSLEHCSQLPQSRCCRYFFLLHAVARH